MFVCVAIWIGKWMLNADADFYISVIAYHSGVGPTRMICPLGMISVLSALVASGLTKFLRVQSGAMVALGRPSFLRVAWHRTETPGS
jgi:hypothetical protein